MNLYHFPYRQFSIASSIKFKRAGCETLMPERCTTSIPGDSFSVSSKKIFIGPADCCYLASLAAGPDFYRDRTLLLFITIEQDFVVPDVYGFK